MNNSSAYNNILLKPAQPQTTVSTPKRTYQDEQQSISFQQNFKDANENVRSHDEKPAKPVKRTEPINKDKPANHIERKNTATVKKGDQGRPRDEISDTKTSNNRTQGESSTAKETGSDSINESAGKESAVKDSSVSNNVAKDDAAKDNAAPDDNAAKKDARIDVPAVAEQDPTLIAPFVTTPPIQPMSDTALTVPQQAATSMLGESPDAQKSSMLAVAEISNASSSEKTINQKEGSTDGDYDGDYKDGQILGSVDTQLGNQIAQSLSEINSTTALNQATDTSANTIAQQTEAALVAGIPTGIQKPATPQSPMQITSELPDENTPMLMSTITMTSPVKVVDTETANASTTTDVDSSTTPISDPKVNFEKAMQNILRPQSSIQGEQLPGANLPSSDLSGVASSSGNNSVLDSLARFTEAQSPAARSFVVQTAVPVPVGQPQWSQAVGEKVLWFAAQNISSAEIHLNPENLGPMQVKVSVNQEQATINFTSHHAVVREVLDQNLGRLRDMFNEQGLNLVNVDVSDKSFSHQQGEAKDQKGQAANKDAVIEEEPVAVSVIKQQRLVDHYA